MEGSKVLRVPQGLVKECNIATDLVLFNPDTVKDISTSDDPNWLSTGIKLDFVNSRVALEKGEKGTQLRRPGVQT